MKAQYKDQVEQYEALYPEVYITEPKESTVEEDCE